MVTNHETKSDGDDDGGADGDGSEVEATEVAGEWLSYDSQGVHGQPAQNGGPRNYPHLLRLKPRSSHNTPCILFFTTLLLMLLLFILFRAWPQQRIFLFLSDAHLLPLLVPLMLGFGGPRWTELKRRPDFCSKKEKENSLFPMWVSKIIEWVWGYQYHVVAFLWPVTWSGCYPMIHNHRPNFKKIIILILKKIKNHWPGLAYRLIWAELGWHLLLRFLVFWHMAGYLVFFLF